MQPSHPSPAQVPLSHRGGAHRTEEHLALPAAPIPTHDMCGRGTHHGALKPAGGQGQAEEHRASLSMAGGGDTHRDTGRSPRPAPARPSPMHVTSPATGTKATLH